MDKNFKQKNRVMMDLERYPQFGTTCSVINDTNYFVPLNPSEKQKMDIADSYIIIDQSYRRKETFYIYINTKDEEYSGKKTKIIFRNFKN
jgi:hypothetical protein